MTLADAYRLVAEVASPSDSEGLRQPRAILLLWYLRNVMGLDDLDAYEYVCDGRLDQGIDGLYLEPAREDDDKHRLYLFQSEYPLRPKNVGVNKVRRLLGSATPFQSRSALQDMLQEGVEPELAALIERFGIMAKLDEDSLELRLVLVAAGKLTSAARTLARSANQTHGRTYIQCHDVLDLAPLVMAFRSPSTVCATVVVPVPESERFITSLENARVAVCSVRASDIVSWPGIDDRTLFDLNVRRELRTNRVRRAIDRAVRRTSDHRNFLAFHNGLTVVCDRIDDTSPSRLTITNLSVVNGAQSTISFKENEASITDHLRVVVKFVEVASGRQLAREVAVRSNTQNPVNPRNLRARDGIQLRLVAEFAQAFPDIAYEIRPDATVQPSGHVIQNDDAAQLLCAVYNQTPWIAIRRLSLFDAERYPTVFTADTSASHVVLVDEIGARVQNAKQVFPPEYLRSWRLTKLVAVYLVGQLLRTKPQYEQILNSPAPAIADREMLRPILDLLVRFAAAGMKIRRDELMSQKTLDDFKVDFKREEALRDLARRARQAYLTYDTVAGAST